MPDYTWKGIDAAGTAKRGTLTADSPAHLKDQLLHAGIALLSYAEASATKSWFTLKRSSSGQETLITFFEYLCHLLESGIPLLTALELVIPQLSDEHVAGILRTITNQVKKGEAFSSTLKKYPEIFTPIVIQLVISGEKTGKLAPALSYLTTHLKSQSAFKKNLVQAAIFPLFTITFAIIIMVGILLFIIPQFENFFSSTEKALPPLTHAILTLSAWLRSWKGLATLVAILAGVVTAKIAMPKQVLQKLISHTPLLGSIITTANLIHVLHMLALFLKAGIPLRDALETIESSVKNRYFKQNLHTIAQAIVTGQGLTTQLPNLAPAKDREILTTFVALGEQTGKLDAMLGKAAVIFEEKLKKQIALFTLFFQPALMIIVGLVIALLMAAVYLPLFNLAYSVS